MAVTEEEQPEPVAELSTPGAEEREPSANEREPDAREPGAAEPDAEEPEAQAPPPLDPEVAARRKVALSYVRKLGDPILKTKARPVDRFDDALRVEVRNMRQLMHDALGIGLAAPQVGISHRLLVYRVEPDSPTVALVNPEIEWSSRDEEIGEEGCLSLPLVHVEVERPIGVLVRARDEHGDELVIEATGLEARVIQHEIDHLDGVLILDRTTREQRKAAMRAMREAEQAARAAS